MEGLAVGWINELMGRWVSRWDGSKWINGWMGLTVGWINGLMDGWVEE